MIANHKLASSSTSSPACDSSWREDPLKLSSFTEGFGHPNPCVRIGQGSRGADNEFSHSADAANRTRRLIFMIRRSFQYLSKLAFIQLYGTLVRPYLECGMLFRANSKISYTVGNWHSSPPLRRETAVAVHSFLAGATTLGLPESTEPEVPPPETLQ